MTKDEAVKAFRAQTPVVMPRHMPNGVVDDIYCKRIIELHYRIRDNGEQCFSVSAGDSELSVYTAGPEFFRLATQEDTATDARKQAEQKRRELERENRGYLYTSPD